MKAATTHGNNRKAETLISIHAAREGGDTVGSLGRKVGQIFQSTPPVKAATLAQSAPRRHSVFQSTPPVKAATNQHPPAARHLRISIHAAREGGDVEAALLRYSVKHFNPRRP